MKTILKTLIFAAIFFCAGYFFYDEIVTELVLKGWIPDNGYDEVQNLKEIAKLVVHVL